MVVKCERCGKDITGTEYAKVSPYICGVCLKKERKEKITKPKTNILGMFISGIKTIFGLPFRALKKVREEKKEAVTPPASTPTVIKKETKVEKPPTIPEVIKLQPTKTMGIPGTATPEKVEKTPYEELRTKVLAKTATAKEFKEYQELKDMLKESKELEEKEAKKDRGLKGRILGGFKEPFKEKGKQALEKTKTEPGKILGESLGKAFKGMGKRWETTKSQVGSALIFAILFPTTFWFTTAFTIPQAEGLLGQPILPNWINMALAGTTTLIVLGLIFFVVLPPSVILGQRGVNFGALNGLLLTSLALGAGLWGTTNLFMPYWQAVDSESYDLTMCLIKYRGNMQICALGEEEIQYEKEGTYETLKSEMGIVTPDRTIPPMRPKVWEVTSSNPYEFPFTLKNENEIGSFYNITVPQINVTSSSDSAGTDPIPSYDFFFPPPFNIRPGEYRIVQALFDDLPDCERYTHFHINLTTVQYGGGSTKYAIVEKEKDNENFMYFFDPEIKTNPGPLDIYLYTYPFVLPIEEVEERQDEDGDKPGFLIYLVISNKQDGIAKIRKMNLIQTSELKPVIVKSIKCGNDPKVDEENGNINVELTWDRPIEKEGEEHKNRVEIRCTGYIYKDTNFVGKTTDFISVVVEYDYTQIFDEQTACYKEPWAGQPCNSLDETNCKMIQGCHWCSCYNHQTASENKCVFSDETDQCGYQCVAGSCGANCDEDTPCGPRGTCEGCVCEYTGPYE